ncbi:hypothetical protein [Planococcus koreensis]|uniref:hypothetical protein n=1 Tax=Planococcus koreensis TaxID=112331 RepID=UPI0039FC0D13
MSFENKLMQMKGMLKKQPTKKQAKPRTIERPAFEEAWAGIGLELIENRFGFVYVKRIRYPLDTIHGNVSLSELDRVRTAWEQAPFEHPFKLKKKNPSCFLIPKRRDLAERALIFS